MIEYKNLLQSKENRTLIRNFLNDVYILSKGSGLKFIEKTEYNIDQFLNLNKEVYFIPEGNFSSKTENIYFIEEVKNKIKNSIFSTNELIENFKLEISLNVGQKFEAISDLYKFNIESHQTINLKMEEGKTSLIYIWSYHSSLSKKHLLYLNNCYEKNQRNWEAHLKIILINIDITKDKLKSLEFFKSLKIQKLTNIFYLPFNLNENHPLINTVLTEGYPITLIVNSDLIIESISSFFDINLEKLIEESKNRKIILSQTNSYGDCLKEDEKIIFKNILNEIPKKLSIIKSNHSIQVPHLINITLIIKKVYTAGNFYLPIQKIQQRASSESNYRSKKHHTRPKAFKNSIINNDKENINISPIKQNSKNQIISNSITQNEKEKLTYTPYSQFVELNYICHPLDDEIISEIFQNLNKINSINIKKNYVSTSEIQGGSSCSSCYRQLSFSIYSNKENQNANLQQQIKINSEELERISEKDDSSINDNIFKKKTIIDNSNLNSPNNIIQNYNRFLHDENNVFYDQFICLICNKCYCLECANNQTDIRNPLNIHKHFLVFLHSKNYFFSKYILSHNTSNIYSDEFKYFQFNNSGKDYLFNSTHHHIKCDGCKIVPIKNIRWKCCNCIFKNLCDSCFKHSFNIKSLFNQEIIQNLKINGCDPIEHVFMKIIFDGYYY